MRGAGAVEDGGAGRCEAGRELMRHQTHLQEVPGSHALVLLVHHAGVGSGSPAIRALAHALLGITAKPD